MMTCIYSTWAVSYTHLTEQGKLTETEFSESMKQRLAMGYILPGQMNGLFTEKEIVAKLGKYSCIALGALDNKANGLHQLGSYGIHCQSVSPVSYTHLVGTGWAQQKLGQTRSDNVIKKEMIAMLLAGDVYKSQRLDSVKVTEL